MITRGPAAARTPADPSAAGRAVAYVQSLIERGELRPGDRLPTERDLVQRIRVSRTSVHVGLHRLAAMGVITIRRGAWARVAEGPPTLASPPLALLSVMHDISLASLSEARQMIASSAAGLAAERATGDQLVAISDEVIGLYSSLQSPEVFHRHQEAFHHAVAGAANNPALAALISMLVSLHEPPPVGPDHGHSTGRLKAASLHRAVYHEIKQRNADGARRAMSACLRHDHARRRAEAASSAERSARVS